MSEITGSGDSPWAPLRMRIFRSMWIAALASNIGSWMHLIAGAWLMTSLTATAAVMVALLQSANALPGFLLSLPGGAMADVFDRRKLILVTQGLQLFVAAALGLLTLTGTITPWALLGLTVLLGAGTTLGLPAYAAITPELVPPHQLPAAISLNSVTVTASLAVGPAIGGVLVATVGPGAVFLLNAASFVAVMVAVGRWRAPGRVSTLPAEHVLSAARTGLRYTANAPEFVAILVRATAYLLAFSAVPALLAVVVRSRLDGSAAGYGLLLGFAGLGGVLGALVLPKLRLRVTPDVLMVGATGGYAIVLFAVGTSRSLPLLMPFLLLGGFAQMTVMSSLNIAAQQVLPAWVRGRGLAIFMLTFQFGIAGGAALWGAVATRLGIQGAFLAAAAMMALTVALAPYFRLDVADRLDVHPVCHPEPQTQVGVDPEDGPVLVATEYDVPLERRAAFQDAVRPLRRVRRREGALTWALFEDFERPGTYVENYLMGSWTEHRRQGERRTGADEQAITEVADQHRGAAPPRTRYLLGQHFRHHQPARQAPE